MTIPRRLTYGDQERILASLTFLCEDMADYAEALRGMGYSSFLAWEEFEIGCCATSHELALLPNFIRERSKTNLGRPDGFLGRERSEYLESLAPWGHRFDGKDQEAWEKFVALRSARTLKYQMYREHERDYLRLETKSLDGISLDHAEYVLYFREALLKSFGRHGFSLDGFRGSEDFPVVSKPLAFGWDICWSAESTRTLDAWPRERSDVVEKWTTVDLRFYARSQRGSGFPLTPIGFKSLDFITIRIDQLINGFAWAYSRINGADELELSLSAYSSLYAQVSGRLENALMSSLFS